MLQSFEGSAVAMVIDIQISIWMLLFFVIYALAHKSQIAHEIEIYIYEQICF